ncbi:response regulator transcription factor [Pseudochryseolinea flava]|uniref:Helix-turn-helix transcriptional regulator n=1 Tax=Pseudochryseolinea flava TaxID=2059302 RepID=A0A364Y0R3_9BACT|nr:LuxR C-terminal-related transcriptional regulator [Pseudochryseolinea flava]RAW00188.1 helix-turn-helix transcriptional regulator [Pseudochryseolinea flava]
MIEKNIKSTLLTKNDIGQVSDDDRSRQHDYLEAVRAFARLTYESVYVIDYEKMTFEYVSDNPIFLAGHTSKEVMDMGYQFYFKNVPEAEIELLNQINEKGFDFFKEIPTQERKCYSITYDFHLINKDGRHMLINHKLTPLFLTSEGKMWKAMCIVSMSRHQHAGHVSIHKQGTDEVWQLDMRRNLWCKSEKPKLNKREIEILHLYARGLTINQIAEEIFVTPDTVKYYRRRIFERLGVSNTVEALSFAIHNKII